MNRLANKKVFFFLMFVIFLIPVVLMLFNRKEKEMPKSSEGFLDLSQWDFNQDGSIKLDGYWEFYPNVLLSPQEIKEETQSSRLNIQVPGRWSKDQGEGIQVDDGIGTYRLKIKVTNDLDILGIRTKNIRISNKIFVNGNQVAACGNPATDKKSGYIAYNLPKAVFFPLTMDKTGQSTIDLVIQVANTNYFNGGIIQSIYLGEKNTIIEEYIREMILDIVIFSFLILTSTYYFVIFLKKKEDKKLIYMSIFCMSLGFLIATGNAKVFFQFVRFIPYLTVIKFRTASVAVLIMVTCSFIGEMSRELISNVYRNIITVLMLVCFLVTLTVPDTYMVIFEKAVTTVYIFTYCIVALRLIYCIINNRHDGLNKKTVLFLLFLDLQFIIEYISSILYYSSVLKSFRASNFTFVLLLLGLCYMFADQYTKAYQNIKDMNDNLIAADKIKDEFLAYTSNEFKSPLYTIMHITRNLINDESAFQLQNQKDNLAYVLNISEKMSGMINNIIDYQNLKNNKLKLYKNVFDIHGVVNAVSDIVRYVNKGHKIELINEIPQGSFFVSVDESRMEQILFNIFDYSIKSTENGLVRISVQESKGYVFIRVAIGRSKMNENDHNEILKEYIPELEGKLYPNSSTGMGVYVSKLLAINMGGDLYHQWSEEDKLFALVLKLVQVRKTDKWKKTQNFLPLSYSKKKETNGLLQFSEFANVESRNVQKPKILLVDDDPVNIKLLYDICKEEFEPIIAHNGPQALEIIKHTKNISLALLDAIMPGISGYEVCKKIREQYTIFELPVLILTVRNATEDIETGFEAGANDFLVKPFNEKEVITRVKTLRNMQEAMQNAIKIETVFLQSQIKQHFLYNSLNSIVSLCYSDPERAGNLLGDLSHYLRCVMEIDPHHSYIDLRKELSLVRSYLELEQARFGDRLHIQLDYDENALDYQIPAFLIQPIIENSIRHGIMGHISGGTVWLTIRKQEESVEVIIKDDGIGMDENILQNLLKGTLDGSIGLKNVIKRLRNEYGESLQIQSTKNQGTCVTIRIPVKDQSKN